VGEERKVAMKLATYLDRGAPGPAPRIGVIRKPDDMIVDLARAHELSDLGAADVPAPALADMTTLLRAGQAAMDAARRLAERPPEESLVPLGSVRLLAPVPRPNTIRDFMAFEGHVLNSLRTMARLRGQDPAAVRVPDVWYRFPAYYKGNPMSVIGPDAEVVWPSYEPKLDYELEFGCFIGKAGKDIPAERAKDHIAGFTIFNDFSARETQTEEMQQLLGPAKGKDFDTGNAMGPYLVTPDEVGDPYGLTMVARVDGEEWSRGHSSGMHWTFEQLIAYVSRDETLYPGDFLGSGTVTTGTGLELDRWIVPGATVELEVERLGALRNRVVRR
jgi:2-keto-4-pentenoate hydratase/2-oxohepta-3-ene-1,7-dioic acid hydratase in catechol pathway